MLLPKSSSGLISGPCVGLGHKPGLSLGSVHNLYRSQSLVQV